MSHVTWKLARDLRDLADQLDSGEVPDKGVAAELGRKVEATLNERRPKCRPHERAKQAHELARLLSRQTGVDVSLSYSPYKGYDGKVTGWKVEWTDGPTDAAMPELVSTLGDRVPALGVSELSYERLASARALVAAMLRHLDERPDDGERYAAQRHNQYTDAWYDDLEYLADYAHRHTSYPERLDESTARRVRAMQSLNGRSSHFYASLAEKIRANGWPAARDWLDQIANDLDNPDLANLADARRDRGQGAAW